MNEISIENKFKKYKQCILIEYLSSRLQNEQTLVSYYNSLLTVKYRDMRRKEKRDEIRQNMIHLISSAKSCINYRNQTIELLKNRLFEYDQLEEHSATSFFIAKNNLIETFNFNLNILKNNYLNELTLTREYYDSEQVKLISLNEESIRKLNDQIILFEANSDQLTSKELELIKSEKSALKSMHFDSKTVFRIESEKRVKQLEIEYLNHKNTYEKNLLYLKRPNALKRKAEQLHKIIIRDQREIHNLNEKIKLVEEKFHYYDDFVIQTKKALLNTKLCEYSKYFKYLKQKEKNRHIKLTQLVVTSSNAIKILKEKRLQLSKILNLIKLCNKKEDVVHLPKNEKVSFNDETNEFNVLLNEEMNIVSNDFNLRNAQLIIQMKSLHLDNLNLKNENIFLRESLKSVISNIFK
jgi:hypothetical protein